MREKLKFLYMTLAIWAIFFGYVAFKNDDPKIMPALLILLLISCVVVGFVFFLLKHQKQTQERIRKLSVFSSIVSEFSDVVAFNEVGQTVYTTHPHLYSNQKEYLRKMLLKIDPSLESATFKKWIQEHHSGELLLSGGGNGLGEQKRRWLARIRAVDPTTMGGQSYVLCVMTDLTDYLENTQKLREQYQQIEHFLDHAPFGLFYVNRAGHFIAANETLCTWLHIAKDALIGEKVDSFFDSSHLNAMEPKLIKVSLNDQSSFKAICFPPNAEKGQAYILCKYDQSLLAMGGSSNDYAEENAFMFSTIPSIVIDPSGMILSINPAFGSLATETIVVEDRLQKTNRTLFDLLDASRISEIQTKLQQILKEREGKHQLEMILGSNKHPMMAHISVISAHDAATQKLLLQFIDISEQKRLEQQFSQSQKMQAVGQLAGGIAHDFNNLLTAMIGFCDLLLQRYLPNDPSYMDVMQIKQNANRAANLVRQLLAFSRQQSLQPRVIDVTDILSELSALMRRLIGVNIDLNLVHGRDLAFIKADVSQLEQVMINLVVNARDAMPEGGTLTIRTSNYKLSKDKPLGHEIMPKGDYVLIEVDDTGSGIPEAIMDRIFEPFFSTKELGAGTGLGLSTVYGIIKQSNAFILVESTLNKGTCFKLYFPRSIEILHEESADAPMAPSTFAKGGTILLVEDEDAVRMFSARALREKGYKVLEAENGEDALNLVKSGQRFDLLVTDVVMPKMDGPTLNKRVRDLYPNTKTIFISGYAEDTFRKNLGTNARIHFLPKPFSLKDLIAKIQEVL
ncbi:MAG: Sensor kinase CckA [Holosporales bacterium]